MNEQTEQVVEAPARAKKPAKTFARAKSGKAKQKRVKAQIPDTRVVGGPFAGVSASRCCNACTEKRCVISTVSICKHPNKTADNGCGPVTMANRIMVRKLIKHQIIDAEK